MSTSTGTTPVCGYCGKPVINAGVWHLGIAYHAECTMAEYEKPEIIRAPELLAFVAEKDKRIADLERQLAAYQWQPNLDTLYEVVFEALRRGRAESHKGG